MKKLNEITAYELYRYSFFDDMNVQFIQFDENMNWHNVGEMKMLEEFYNEWNENNREDCLFTALIKWFNIEDGKVIICLKGTDGRLHYED